MKFNSHYYPHASRRVVTHARNGMVATSHPLAAQAGLTIMQKGGNAIDAAIAAAATLTVVEPTSNGIGSDAFAIVWTKDKLHGLNSSGYSPAAISIDALKERGLDEMPKFGLTPVNVPGAPAAWAGLAKRFGKLPLIETLQPAIGYAMEGYPLSPTCAYHWHSAYNRYKTETQGAEFQPYFDTFAPGGRPPRAGEMWNSPGHAHSLELIGQSQAEAFYKGELAEKIDDFSRKFNGFLRGEDLAAYQPEWVDPISVDYHGYKVWELPPNGQGIVALMALNILKDYQLSGMDEITAAHHKIEAIKLAFSDGMKYVTDPGHMSVKVEDLLSEAFAEKRRLKISDQALTPEPSDPNQSGTVYLCTADAAGNMVSYIQSNYMGFGSGIVIPGTGISLQNRGHNFSMDPEHDNCLAPRKRPYHTIIPGFLTKGEVPVGPFGVMGGFMQPQGHLQVVSNMIDYNLNPQAAIDAPRWQWISGKTIQVEHTLPHHVALALKARGHDIQVALESAGFGRGEIIQRDPETGVLSGGTEPRTDGCVAAY
jgi:gamma-glutamyltranspeptidase/glutathione hydrolase